MTPTTAEHLPRLTAEATGDYAPAQAKRVRGHRGGPSMGGHTHTQRDQLQERTSMRGNIHGDENFVFVRAVSTASTLPVDSPVSYSVPRLLLRASGSPRGPGRDYGRSIASRGQHRPPSDFSWRRGEASRNSSACGRAEGSLKTRACYARVDSAPRPGSGAGGHPRRSVPLPTPRTHLRLVWRRWRGESDESERNGCRPRWSWPHMPTATGCGTRFGESS